MEVEMLTSKYSEKKFFFQWLKTVVVGWLSHIYGGNSSVVAENSQKTINKFEQKLSHLLYETYTRTRIEQLFNIIIGI